MSQRDPAFLFYSKDWIEGTAHMRPEEKGIYADLLAYQHQRGSLPEDTETLARLVRMSVDEFDKVWAEVSKKFVQNGQGIVNRKLKSVMDERKEKGRKNKLIGTFGYVLNKLNLNKTQKKKLRSAFNVDEMLAQDSEWNSERLTEWCRNAIALIENGNENEDYLKIFNKIKSEFELESEFEKVISDWLKYKSERRESYKEEGMRSMISKLVNLSYGNVNVAREIIEQSKANNWAGLFQLKENKSGFLPGQKIKTTHGKKRDY